MKPLISTFTPAERRIRQRRAYELLGEFLQLMDDQELPVIDWLVTEFALVGTLPDVPYNDRRRVFDRWVEALDLERWGEQYRGDGWVHLHARTENWNSRRVSVTVWVDIDTEVSA